MCGRFSLGTPAAMLADLFQVPEVPDWAPRYNIAPTQPVLVVLRGQSSALRQSARRRWGLIPSWAKDPAIGNRLINARAETVATKPAFRRAFRERRCLILADGFYEWERQGQRKQPFCIRMRRGHPFAFAALWERWQGPEASPLDTCTILTTTANDLVGRIHNRMPVILAPADYEAWLDPSIQDPERLRPLLRPSPADEMVAYPVGPRVNNPANDSPTCLEPLL